MNRVLFLVCSMVLVVSGVRGQDAGRVNTSDSRTWSTYTIPGEDFSVALPTLPAMVTSKEFRTHLQRERKERNLRTDFDGVNYGIDVFDNPGSQSLDAFIAEYKANSDFSRSTEREITVNGIHGKEYSNSGSPSARVQFFATEHRLYRFIAVGADANNASVKQFFASISFEKNSAAVKVSDGPGMPLQLRTGERIYKGREVDKRVRMISKPEPQGFGKERGLVVLQAVFSWEGKVVNIEIISTAGAKLTDAAIEAAQKIRFEPAMKDGKPVSTYMMLEYNFNL